MSLIKTLLQRSTELPLTSKYTLANGLMYLAVGSLLLVWPEVTQVIFGDAAFVGHEAELIRALGMALMVIGWLYVFGARSGGQQLVAASVLDRVVLVPVVLLPLAYFGVFPRLFTTFAILDVTLGVGAWVLLARSPKA